MQPVSQEPSRGSQNNADTKPATIAPHSISPCQSLR